MGKIVMTAITPEQAGNRDVMDTGVSMLGLGGDDWICGHCGRMMIQSMDLKAVQTPMAYRCGVCEGLNIVGTAPPQRF